MSIKRKKAFFSSILILSFIYFPLFLAGQNWWEDSGRTFKYDLLSYKILVLLGDDFDYHELMVIRKIWEKWGAKIHIAGNKDVLKGHLWAITPKRWEKKEFREIKPDLLLSEVNVGEYQAIFLPGGNSPSNLIKKDKKYILDIIQNADRKGILLSGICHGPYVLAVSNVINGVSVTGHREIEKDLERAGGKYVRDVCVVDKNIITGNWLYFESFALNVAERLLYPDENMRSRRVELESHLALKNIKERRSIRRYKEKDIDPFLIEELMYMASWAPSSNNDQPWIFVVVKDGKIKKQIFNIFITRMQDYYQKRSISVERMKSFWSGLFTAPVFIFVFNNPEEKDTEDEFSEIQKIWNIQSISNACQNLLLAAKAMDLGTCWIGALLTIEPEIKKLLGAPEEAQLMTVIALGYPAEDPFPRIRKSISEIVYYEKWEQKKK